MPGQFVELRKGVDNLQSRPRRALRVVVVRRRPPEQRHHAVAEVFHDVSAEARDRVRRQAMVFADGLAPFLGIELRRNRCRSDEIGEQHREMTPLARHFSRPDRRHCRRRGDRSANQRSEHRAASAAEFGCRGVLKTVRSA